MCRAQYGMPDDSTFRHAGFPHGAPAFVVAQHVPRSRQDGCVSGFALPDLGMEDEEKEEGAGQWL
jgi:hypothetical protein